jgi:hypothetical protein
MPKVVRRNRRERLLSVLACLHRRFETRARQFELQQVAGPAMAFRGAVTFEVAVAGLCQLGAVWPPALGHRLNDM